MAEDNGFLIDLDLAIKIDCENASGAPSKTGIKFLWPSAYFIVKTIISCTIWNCSSKCCFEHIFVGYEQASAAG
jgi:hypothetical protein